MKEQQLIRMIDIFQIGITVIAGITMIMMLF